MRITLSVFLLGLVVALGLSVAGEVDSHNCDVCKPMTTEPDLMQNIRWDSKEIAAGMIYITTVAPDYEEAYTRAHAEMMKAVKRLEAGEQMELCPFCQSMGRLAAAGAQIENVAVAGAHVMVITSSKPEVIDKIHAHAKWVKDEFSKMDHEHKG